MEKNKELIEDAIEFAKTKDLDIIELSEKPNKKIEFDGISHEILYDVGVEEWLGLMDEAEYIFTNSFHACCFSIIFEKQFFAGSRSGDKIDSVLEMFSLSWRRCGEEFNNSCFDLEDIDFSTMKPILGKYIKESTDFILNAITDVASREHKSLPAVKSEMLSEENIEKEKKEFLAIEKKKSSFRSKIKRRLKRIFK